MKRLTVLALALVTAVGSLAAAVPAGAARSSTSVTLVTHDFFAVSKQVLERFTARTGIEVEILRAGDGITALNQIILTKGNPVGDVFFGVDNTILGRALDAGVFERYEPRGLARVPNDYQLDPSHHLTPVDRGDVCINVDHGWFARHQTPVPQALEDLTKPMYADALVVENPATSTPGLAFALATIARFGEDGWLDYWADLRANGVAVVNDWGTAYEGRFTQGGGDGTYPLVVSYASSPPAAVLDQKDPKTSPVSTMLDSCFQQIEFAGVLAGTDERAAARKLVDFMLSKQFQADVPLSMFVFPVREGTTLPTVFEQFAEVAPDPLVVPPDDIEAHRDEWIDQWTQTVLR